MIYRLILIIVLKNNIRITFLSDKYGIWPINWTKSFSIVLRKFYDYVDKHVYSANEATLIRDLCIKLDSGDFSFFNIDELNEMVVLLCTA